MAWLRLTADNYEDYFAALGAYNASFEDDLFVVTGETAENDGINAWFYLFAYAPNTKAKIVINSLDLDAVPDGYAYESATVVDPAGSASAANFVATYAADGTQLTGGQAYDYWSLLGAFLDAYVEGTDGWGEGHVNLPATWSQEFEMLNTVTGTIEGVEYTINYAFFTYNGGRVRSTDGNNTLQLLGGTVKFELYIEVQDDTAPAVSVTPNPLQFGERAIGSVASETISLTNSGDAALVWRAAVMGNKFTLASTPGGTLAAGVTVGLKVNFIPVALADYVGTLTITSNASSSPDTVAITGTGVSPVGSNEDLGRVSRNYVSAYARDRVHETVLYANERRALITDFNGAIPKGRTIAKAVWQSQDTSTCAMSAPGVFSREVQVTIAAQYRGIARIRVDATLDDGSIYSAWHFVIVRPAPQFGGEGWVNGPTRLEAEAS